MEFFIFIFVMWMLFGGFSWLKDKLQGNSPTTRTRPNTRTQPPPKKPETYRPTRRPSGQSTIKFCTPPSPSSSNEPLTVSPEKKPGLGEGVTNVLIGAALLTLVTQMLRN